ncbi:MAG: succinate CoA transferase [Bacteroidaceae bacterium]|nr:succinate CoA transferase [Bacteroidaceae bacterium]
MSYPILTPQEAACYINNGDGVGISGFTLSGTPKAVLPEVANRAREAHEAGKPFKIRLYSGASTGDTIDGMLSRANALEFRAPFISNPTVRTAINNKEMTYTDLHLSLMAQDLRYGYLGKVDIAILEAIDITPDGKVYLTTAGGIGQTVANLASKIIIERNTYHHTMGLHDVYEPLDPPCRKEIPIYNAADRIGKPYVQVDPKKVIGIVEVHQPNEQVVFKELDPVTRKIGENVVDFILSDMRRGTIPATGLPIQSGIGNVANAVLKGLENCNEIPPLDLYSEVLQDSVIDLMELGRVKVGSTCSLSLSQECMKHVYDNLDFFKDKLILRPSEISNHPEIIRRLGIIAMNTAIEVDLYGCVNSSHICGTRLMNGIGGSGDFARNAYVSIFTCPSTQKGGMISSIVPMVTHADHTEHDVRVVVTEWGVADLRGKGPDERARLLIENCAHPDYRNMLWDYLKIAKSGHVSHNVAAALGMHAAFEKEGDMRLTDWNKFA